MRVDSSTLSSPTGIKDEQFLWYFPASLHLKVDITEIKCKFWNQYEKPNLEVDQHLDLNSVTWVRFLLTLGQICCVESAQFKTTM